MTDFQFAASLSVLALLLASPAPLAAAPIPRKPPIEKDPHSSSYTTYDYANEADRAHAVASVRAVTANGSFISRSLLVISNFGLSKKFETITGEDGLTFGIKDFTSGGVLPLLKLVHEQDGGAIKHAFGPLAAQVLDPAWLNAHTSTHDDRGLIAIREFRVGLDEILDAPKFHGAQLRRYRIESVDPSLAAFQKRGYKLEFSLAAMIGVANSFGAGSEAGNNGMIGRLKAAAGSADEGKVMREFVRAYAVRDARNAAQRAAAEKLVRVGFGDAAGSLPSEDELSHSGRRIRLLFQVFPWKQQAKFSGLGEFALAANEGPH